MVTDARQIDQTGTKEGLNWIIAQLLVTCLNGISFCVSVASQRNQGCLEDARMSSACEGFKRFDCTIYSLRAFRVGRCRTPLTQALQTVKSLLSVQLCDPTIIIVDRSAVRVQAHESLGPATSPLRPLLKRFERKHECIYDRYELQLFDT